MLNYGRLATTPLRENINLAKVPVGYQPLSGIPFHARVNVACHVDFTRFHNLWCGIDFPTKLVRTVSGRLNVDLVVAVDFVNTSTRKWNCEMEAEITPTQQMLSSCSGAIVTSLFMTPLDVVKIRLQSQTSSMNKCFLYCNGLMDHLCVCVNGNGKEKWYRRPGQFNGTFDAMIKIARYEGITSLWSGLSPTLIMAVPATVLYFTSYDQLKSLLEKKYGNNMAIIPAVAGGIARTGTVSIISPLELIRTKMQSRPVTYSEIATVITQSVRSSGLGSLWTGWAPTIMRDVPFSMLYWFGYEAIKKELPFESLFLKAFFAGFGAGTFATIITHPMDLTKTRRQITLGEKALERSTLSNMSSWNILKDVISQNGIRGIFTGLIPRVAKIGPACAIMISSYEFGKRFFREYNGVHSFDPEKSHA